MKSLVCRSVYPKTCQHENRACHVVVDGSLEPGRKPGWILGTQSRIQKAWLWMTSGVHAGRVRARGFL